MGEDFLRLLVIFIPTFIVTELSVKNKEFTDQYVLQNESLIKKEEELKKTQQDLQEQIIEMKKLQKLMVGRELRIVELKKELKKQSLEES